MQHNSTGKRRSSLNSYRALFAQWVLMAAALAFSNPSTANADTWSIGAVPVWVEAIPAFETASVEQPLPDYGVEHRLLDYQRNIIDREAPSQWVAIEYVFTSGIGVEEHTDLSIDFDPSYQSVVLNELLVSRGGEVQNRIAEARIDLLHREPHLNAGTFDGHRTLSVVLNDIRVGDVLRASWTIHGSNPIFAGKQEFSLVTTRAYSTLSRTHLRVLNDPEKPLNVRSQGHEATHTSITENGVETIVVDIANPPLSEADDPDVDTVDRGLLVFSDIPGWQDVAVLEAPFYAIDQTQQQEIKDVAALIRQQHPDTASQVGAAMQWVQDEIRYFAIQIGASSHQPASVSDTLSRRYGDCKAVTLVLLNLLAELGISAQPALVNTRDGLKEDDFPWRLHAFDHVLTTLVVDGERHWIDPTRRLQRGPLGRFHEPDYGRALILAEDQQELLSMQQPRSGWYMTVDNTLDLSQGEDTPASLVVVTRTHGDAAEGIRRFLETDGVDGVSRSYQDYFERNYGSLKTTDTLTVEEKPDGGLVLTERYLLDDFWTNSRDGTGDTRSWFGADTVNLHHLVDLDTDALPTVATTLEHPVELTERWQVNYATPIRVLAETDRFDTPWYSFTRDVSNDTEARTLAATMTYRSLADTLEVEDAAAYADAFDSSEPLIWVSIQNRPPNHPWVESTVEWLFEAAEEADEEPVELTLREKAEATGAAVLIAGILPVALWRRRRQNTAMANT